MNLILKQAKNIGFIFIIVLFTSCVTSKYYVTSNPENINSFHSKGYPYTSTYQVKNKIILIPQDLESRSLVKMTVRSLQNKNYTQLYKYLQENESDVYYPFCMGLLKMHQNKFSEALRVLKQNAVGDIQHLTDLLIVDCEYEIELVVPHQVDFESFLQKYQNIIDRYSLSEPEMDIIRARIKFLRYRL